MSNTAEDVMAEFQRCCAEARNMMRMSCQNCDICFYYNAVDVDKLAESNPWSFDEDETETHRSDYTTSAVVAPVPQYPAANKVINLESLSSIREESFDDSLIVPSFHSQVTRPISEAVNDSMFKIGIVQKTTDPISIGPYELTRRTSSVRFNERKSLSISRPRTRTASVMSGTGSTLSLYESSTREDDDGPPTPTTPDLEPANSLDRTSTDSSEGSVSEEDLDIHEALSAAVVRRSSQLDSLIDYHQLKAWEVYGGKTPSADTQGTITAFSKPGSIKRAMSFGRRSFLGRA